MTIKYKNLKIIGLPKWYEDKRRKKDWISYLRKLFSVKEVNTK